MRHVLIALLVLAFAGAFAATRAMSDPAPLPLVTGRMLAHLDGVSVGVGSFPAQMAVSPDGRWIAVVSIGDHQSLCLFDTRDGHLVTTVLPGSKDIFYAGLCWAGAHLYVSRGPLQQVGVYRVDANGQVQAEAPIDIPPASGGGFVAGLCPNSDGTRLYAVQNECGAASQWMGAVSVIDLATRACIGTLPTRGFPYAVAALTDGPLKDRRIYVTSESDATVCSLDPGPAGMGRKDIAVGDHPVALAFDATQQHLFVANSGSDSISVIDTARDAVVRTLNLRPGNVRQLPGLTPTGMVRDGNLLYVTLGDLNAVAVVEINGDHLKLRGFRPTGWYPTSAVVADRALYVANAKGTRETVPSASGRWGSWPLSALEGSVSRLPLIDPGQLADDSRQALTLGRMDGVSQTRTSPVPAIKHVIYVIKENRTYDQVLGDLPQGNGDRRLTMFGRDVTPNLHALASRFVLLDHFFCCAEVSGDGWNWSTAGMASAYTERNVPYEYAHNGRDYDFEGNNNDVPVDLIGRPDVARPPAGYLWDLCVAHNVSFRNYGCFPIYSDHTGPKSHDRAQNLPTKRALLDHTDDSYRRFDLDYADSDAWKKLGLDSPHQMKAFGVHDAVSRMEEFRGEFTAFCEHGNLPQLVIVDLPRDHTAGTAKGMFSPEAMVADNDYAVGQLVEMVSRSRYWLETAIIIVEDDAQSGLDHVDCHRSTCYVVSPWVKRHLADGRFYNTDSALRTIERLLHLPPMCQFDAIAPVLDVFGDDPENAEPYTAVMPSTAVLSHVNNGTEYRSSYCGTLDFKHPDRVPDRIMNDILWHAMKGGTPIPSLETVGTDDDD